MQNQRHASQPSLQRTLAASLQLKHDPKDTLQRFITSAESEVSARGVTLTIGTAEDLLTANLANSASWIPLFCLFDHRNGGLSNQNFIVILGHDADGSVVAAGAARLFEWPNTSLQAEASSLRLFYETPATMANPGETCTVTATSADQLRGTVVYSGAAWYRPDFRGRQLSSLIPRIVKAVAHGQWGADYIVSFMTKSVHTRGFTKMLSYTHLEWGLQLQNSIYGDTELALLWMTEADLLVDLTSHMPAAVAQIDAGVVDCSTEKKRRPRIA